MISFNLHKNDVPAEDGQDLQYFTQNNAKDAV